MTTWARCRTGTGSAALYAQLIEQEIGDGETGAFLLWGEPTLYDSTCAFSTWSASGRGAAPAGHSWHQQRAGAGGAAQVPSTASASR
jgi:hypothetical protein